MTQEPGYITIPIRTPDNVIVPFTVAPAASRALALLLDVVIILIAVIALVVMVIGLIIAFGGTGANFIGAFAVFFLFVLFNFYFPLSELRLQGRTIGKWALGIRVIARDGGPLSPRMVFTRNLTRELEHFLPVIALWAPEAVFPGAGWARAASIIWLVILLILPLTNRYRARVGDLIAGTVVVVAPKASLLEDLSAQPTLPGRVQPQFNFTAQQLDIYGIKELQTLEEVLRNFEAPEALLLDICDRIKRKINWPPHQWNVPSRPFLQAFYTAQRARLEQKMLFGKRQEEKIR